jgi:transposase-like protein
MIHKKHGASFKLKVALRAIKGDKTVAELCSEFGIAASQLYAWKKQLEEQGERVFADKRAADQKSEIDRLLRIIGQVTAERDFLSRALGH